jgi:hypothetical protein
MTASVARIWAPLSFRHLRARNRWGIEVGTQPIRFRWDEKGSHHSGLKVTGIKPMGWEDDWNGDFGTGRF